MCRGTALVAVAGVSIGAVYYFLKRATRSAGTYEPTPGSAKLKHEEDTKNAAQALGALVSASSMGKLAAPEVGYL